MTTPMQDVVKTAGDVLSVTTVIGTVAGWFPAIAALFAITWSAAQILMNWDKIKESFNKHIRGK